DGRKRQALGKCRDERGGEPDGGERQIWGEAEHPGRVLCDDRFLAQQTGEVAIRLQQAGAAPAREACLALAHQAGQSRRQYEHKKKLEQLEGGGDHCDTATTMSRRASAMNIRL